VADICSHRIFTKPADSVDKIIERGSAKPRLGYFQGKRNCRLIAIGAILLQLVGFIAWALWSTRGSAEVKVLFSHFQNVPGGQVAVFQVSNIGKRSVTMYGPHAAGGEWPLYWVLWRNGTNWDWDSSPSSDPVEMQPIVLPPGAKIPMFTFLPALDRWMVGVQYSTAPYARILSSWVWRHESLERYFKRRMRIAWSDPITRSSKPSNVVAPLGAVTNQISVAPALTNQIIVHNQ
jgi:hypothetical protein